MKLVALAALAFAIPAQAKLVTGEITKLAAIDCGADTLYAYSLEAKAEAETPTAGAIEKLIGMQTSVAPTSKTNLRLEFCFVDGTKAVLKRIVSAVDPAKPQVFTVGEATMEKAEGIDNAFMLMDYDKLEILAHDEEGAVSIKGTGESYKGFIAAVEGGMKNGKLEVKSPAALVGGLSYGDVFANAACPLGQAFKASSFKIGTASFETEICTFQSAGETTGYDIIKMKVTDTSANIASASRGVPVELAGDALKGALKHRFNHHNACDSFILRAEQLGTTYAATAPPMAGCGQILPGAPDQKFNFDDPAPRRVKYKTTYPNGVVFEGEADKDGHYLRLW